jgi:drug/metabolite transporter (DMT)-like permease
LTNLIFHHQEERGDTTVDLANFEIKMDSPFKKLNEKSQQILVNLRSITSLRIEQFITFWKSSKGALVLMFISAIFFSLMALFGQEVTDKGFDSTELVLLRSCGQAILLTFPLSWFLKISLLPPKPARWLVACRGIVGAVAFQCYYKAIECLPLGNAITLFSIYPVFTVAFSIPLLGEKLTVKVTLAVLLSIVGAACIAQPYFLFGDSSWTDSSDDTSGCEEIGYVAAFVGSFFGGLVLTTIRMIGTSAHTVHLLFSQFVFVSLGSLLLYFVDTDWVLPGEDEIWDILLMILFGSVAQFIKNYAGRICHAGAGSIMRSTDVVWAYLWQITIFHVLPDSLAVIGAVLVLLSGLIVGLTKEKKGELEYGTIADEETRGASEGVEALNPSVHRDDNVAVKYI